MTNAIIGTNAYDKWLAEYRVSLSQGENDDMESLELFIGVLNKRARHDYTIECVRIKDIHIKNMIVKHKKLYYKKMAEMNLLKAWKAFDEICDINDDIKQEIHKYLR